MKYSFYNFYIEKNNGGYLYNSLTGALAKLDGETADKVRVGDTEIQDSIFSNMLKCGFLVEDMAIEENKYLNFRKKSFENDQTLRLVIAPTLDCNFRCSYCYEEHLKLYMNDGTVNKIVEYVREKLLNEKYKKLVVCWYGGEPLMGKSIIFNLAKKLIQLTKEYSIPYGSMMISNGYLLDFNTAKTLKELKVDNIQITVDGTKRSHGQRRVLFGNSNINTYDKTIESINNAAKAGIMVQVRMNIDKTNYKEFFEGIEELSKNIIDKKLVRIYAAKIFYMDDTATTTGNVILDSKIYTEAVTTGVELSKKFGFMIGKNDVIPKTKKWFCSAPSGNSIVIDPNGDFYYCWNDIGNKKYRVGSLYDTRVTEQMIYEKQKWETIGKNIMQTCKLCKSLPLCGGGCPRNKVHFDKAPECVDQVKNVDILVRKVIDRMNY